MSKRIFLLDGDTYTLKEDEELSFAIAPAGICVWGKDQNMNGIPRQFFADHYVNKVKEAE